jgi:metallophosphoesterase (TIGR03768 family)
MKKRLIYPLILVVILIATYGCTNSKSGSGISPASKYTSTLDRTLIEDAVPAIPTAKISDPEGFVKSGYGTWHYGPGIPCQKRVDLMPAGYDYASAKNSTTLLRFFTITDIHITDKESPAQAMYFAPEVGPNAVSLLSPLMCYTTQVFDAAVKTINDIHSKDAFDLGLSLGDMANSSQYNELRWFINILDGVEITPSSGTQPAGAKVPYQSTFKPVGLNPEIPWYATIGNHDHFWIGSKPMNDKIRHALIGDSILQVGDILLDPEATSKSTFSTGTYDCSGPYPKIIGCGKVSTMGKIPTISPDSSRHALSITDFIKEFSHTTSKPTGHGFIQSDPKNVLGGCYAFLPKAGLPLKIIVLDDTQDPNEPPFSEGIYGHGELTKDRYDWLISQLKAGQSANQLMVISAHIPIGIASTYSPFAWKPTQWYGTEQNLIDTLRSFPNLILWVAGHRHLNNITAFPSKDPNHPENSFWEVETKSLREFPEQLRTFDIVKNDDKSISIITLDVDVEMTPGSLADKGRFYAVASKQIYNLQETPLETGSVSYNAELFKQLSPVMKAKLENYAQ